MDRTDEQILAILKNNGRATVKEIAKQVSLTSPAVSERIRRMEKSGIIEGYTVLISPAHTRNNIHALVMLSVAPADRSTFFSALNKENDVQVCYQVTGSHSHMVKVSCEDIESLEKLISRLQKWGPTNTQIILSTFNGNPSVTLN